MDWKYWKWNRRIGSTGCRIGVDEKYWKWTRGVCIRSTGVALVVDWNHWK